MFIRKQTTSVIITESWFLFYNFLSKKLGNTSYGSPTFTKICFLSKSFCFPVAIDTFFKVKKRKSQARHQWLMSVILATQEAEIRMIEVRSQPRQIVSETLS
jgi:hypothetical protein